jgi:hypothetical protein
MRRARSSYPDEFFLVHHGVLALDHHERTAGALAGAVAVNSWSR